MGLKSMVKKIFSPLVLLNIAGMVVVGVAVCIALKIWMEDYTMHGLGVDVPDVKGMTLNDASYALDKAELVSVVVDSAYVREQPVGTVLDQKPAQGSRVKSGREVYLTINQKMTPTKTIPDLAGNCSRREAEAKLRSLGFKIGPIQFIAGDPDWVYALKVRGREVYAGERVPNDVPVVLVVGNNQVDGETLDEEIGSEWGSIDADGADMDDSEYEEEL